MCRSFQRFHAMSKACTACAGRNASEMMLLGWVRQGTPRIPGRASCCKTHKGAKGHAADAYARNAIHHTRTADAPTSRNGVATAIASPVRHETPPLVVAGAAALPPPALGLLKRTAIVRRDVVANARSVKWSCSMIIRASRDAGQKSSARTGHDVNRGRERSRHQGRNPSAVKASMVSRTVSCSGRNVMPSCAFARSTLYRGKALNLALHTRCTARASRGVKPGWPGALELRT